MELFRIILEFDFRLYLKGSGYLRKEGGRSEGGGLSEGRMRSCIGIGERKNGIWFGCGIF